MDRIATRTAVNHEVVLVTRETAYKPVDVLVSLIEHINVYESGTVETTWEVIWEWDGLNLYTFGTLPKTDSLHFHNADAEDKARRFFAERALTMYGSPVGA